jgi:CheY-like chemotaxis protein
MSLVRCLLSTSVVEMRTETPDTRKPKPPRTASDTADCVRVLVADDDTDIRFGIARLLRLLGYKVRAVSSGAELLDVLASWILDEVDQPPTDIIVTDVRMPGFNGLSIVEGLRANGWTQPVIVISAFDDDELRSRIDKLSDVQFLAKPFDLPELERTIAHMLLACNADPAREARDDRPPR